MALSSLGVGSGLDLSSIISGLMQAEQQPLITLQTKEAAVQSRISALGSLKNVLSSLQTAASGLTPDTTQSAVEKFSSFKAKSADETIATATATNGAVAANYTLTDITLSSAEQIRKSQSALTIPTTGTGTLSIKIGTGDAVEVSVTGGMTLSDIAKAINDSDAKVSATVINDGTTKHLVVSASESGASNTLSITGSTDWESFNYKPTSDAANDNVWTQQQGANSASVKVNGLTLTGNTNTFADAIPGVTINLLKSSAAGTSVAVTHDNKSSITAALNSFIKAYNDAATSMKTLGAYNEATKVAGTLQGDATLRSAQSQVFKLLTSTQGSGDYKILADIGVSLQKDGTLKLDATKLNKAIDTDFSAVSNLVSSVGSTFKTGINSLVDTKGTITSATDSANRMVKEYQRREEAMNIRLQAVQARYTKQFSALDTLIANMNQTSSSLTQMLANLPGAASNNNN